MKIKSQYMSRVQFQLCNINIEKNRQNVEFLKYPWYDWSYRYISTDFKLFLSKYKLVFEKHFDIWIPISHELSLSTKNSAMNISPSNVLLISLIWFYKNIQIYFLEYLNFKNHFYVPFTWFIMCMWLFIFTLNLYWDKTSSNHL